MRSVSIAATTSLCIFPLSSSQNSGIGPVAGRNIFDATRGPTDAGLGGLLPKNVGR